MTRTWCFGKAEMLGEQVLHHVRRLGAVVDGQRAPRRRSSRRRWRAARCVTPVWRPKTKVCLDHRVGLGEGLVDLAGVERALEGRDCRRAQDGSPASSGSSAVSGSVTARQFLVLDLDQLARRPRPARAAARPRRRPLRPASRRGRRRSAYCGADLMPFRCVSTPTQGVMTLASSGAGDDRDHARRLLRGSARRS